MENVRLLVQEEGRAARNLIAFHVDVATPVSGKVLNRKPPSSPRLLNDIRMTKRSAIVAKAGSRVRSASTGRDKKSELQARYWAFLFGNLQRAVDEIYQTCESDESVSECKEVILVLENFTRDFHNLIEWFRLKWEYENTPPPQRPTSLAWEVRKSSPNKAVGSSRIDKGNKSDKTSPAKKQLNFFSEVKLSSADEVSRRVLTPDSEQILSNQYGLSFGDINLKEHLQVSGSAIQESGDGNINCNGSGEKSDEDNKENYSSLIIENNNNNVEKIQTEVLSINQSSQTDTQLLQSNKVVQKIAGLSSQQTTKKPPPSSSKLNVSTPAKPSVVLTPLAVNKTTSGASVRKTVPLSPTNTVPPRNVIPGRNVAAAAFVPSKKPPLIIQNKIHPPIVNKPSVTNKAHNSPSQIADKNINNEENVQKNVIDTNKIVETNNSDNSEDVINSSKENHSSKISDNQVITDLQPTMDGEEKSRCSVPNTNCIVTSCINDKSNITSSFIEHPEFKDKEEKELKITVTGNEKEKETSTAVNSSLKIVSDNNLPNSDQSKLIKCHESLKNLELSEALTINNSKDEKSVIKPPQNTSIENVNIENNNNLKPEKCDKTVMTDFPQIDSVSQTTVKQQTAKVVALVRNKTVPNFVRKSNETLSASDSLTESYKVTKSNTVNPTKTLTNAVRKQLAIPETTTVKPAYSSVSKVFRSNTALELRPSKLSRNAIGSTSRNSSQIKQVSSLNKSKNSAGKNDPLVKDSNKIFKSEQSLKKKNSIDEDGWETVKGRSRWRLSQSSGNIKARIVPASSRFYLPSPATSLPALALASEDSEPEVKPAKLHKDKQNQEIAKANKSGVMIRKMLSTPKHAEKSEVDTQPLLKSKSKDMISERKSKTIINDRKKMSNVRSRIFATKKVDSEEKSDSAENKMEKYMDILSSEDERMNEEEIRKSMELYEEEKMLTKEIQDLEKAAIEMDTETDDAETDGETTAGTEEDEDTDCRITALKASYEDVCHKLSWADQMDTLEKLEQLMAMDTSTKGIPFSERLTTLEQLEELVGRHPGRALELHQKLSSPSRRRPLPDTIQRHHARQANAKQKREQLLHDKSAKMRELLNKVEEVKMAQAQLVEERKKRLADKLKRAEENRASHLRSIQRKAHDEEEKLREIAFINELEAQNKRHDFMALCQEQQDRLQGILDERQRRLEEKAAKEAAVEERRRILEAERQEKLEKMQERRRKREERIGREQQEKEKERLELAREKARDREERLQALQAAKLATVEELQKKIQQKQFDSARRHEENIEHIRQRALESGALRSGGDEEAPRLTPYDTHKMCCVCNILIESEVHLLSHLRGKAHEEAVKERDDSEEIIIDAPPDKMNLKLAQDRERQKALRKRCKKIRARMALRGEEYQAMVVAAKKLESPNKGRLFKCLKEVDKLQSNQGVGQWPNNAITLLERNLGEIVRILDKQNVLDQKVFRELNGFSTLSNILNLALDIPKNMSPYLPPKCFMTTCTVYSLACSNNPDNSRFVFFTNKIALVLDLLLNRLNALITDDYKSSSKTSTNLPVDPVAGALMKLFALILSNSQDNVTNDVPDMAPRLQDIISYTVSVGVVDKLALYCRSVQEPIDNVQAAQFLLSAIQLLTTLAQTKCGLAPTQLVATLRVTELVGAVSMLYCTLLHQGGPPKEEASLPPHAVAVTSATLRLLKAVAQLDLNMFQSVLGAEGMSLQLRHIASYLLWYCSHTDEKDLLHQVIEVVGYFAVMHYDNQMMLQSGHMPTVLQQLCNLPFEYFSDPVLSSQLFPTLLACCHGNTDNRAILEQELSYQLLEDFKNSESALSNPLVQLLK